MRPYLFAALLATACLNEGDESTSVDGKISVTITNGMKSETFQVDRNADTENTIDSIVRRLGGRTTAEMKAAIEYLPNVPAKVKCLHVKNNNVRGYLDPAGQVWNGVLYDFGPVPVLGTTNDGKHVKSYMPVPSYGKRTKETGEFAATYFRAEDLSLSPRTDMPKYEGELLAACDNGG